MKTMTRIMLGFAVLALAALTSAAAVPAWRFAALEKDKLILDNGRIRRVIAIDREAGAMRSESIALPGEEGNFLASDCPEFGLEVDGVALDGKGPWRVEKVEPVFDALGGHGAAVWLRGEKGATSGIGIEVHYLLYPDLPLIRKKLAVVNRGASDRRVEAVDVERFHLPWGDTHCWIMTNYARQRRLGPYLGNWDDPAVVVHNIRGLRGLVLGNEAPGVTKRTSVFLDGSLVEVGLTHPDQDYPFRKWLKPGERWEGPPVFLAAYRGSNDPGTAINGPVNDFIRRHMGIRLAVIPERPIFVYNTWNPFRKNVNTGLIRELAEAAAECGVGEFIIDDGWQTNRGDWEVDSKKFPGGLKPVFDHIKSLGMKPGLWISLTAAEPQSRVYQEHPEWFVRDPQGEITNLHSRSSREKTACLTTGWYDHIRGAILRLVEEHGLAYVKLDLTIVKSAYVYDTAVAGCYATDHPGHRDRQESFLAIYRRCMDLFDDLHRAAPDLFIDCTFETWGTLQLIDYALVKHAEGDWLSNVEEPVPYGSLRVRNLGWWRSPAVPATALVIGNLTLDDAGRETALMSLAGSLPIMLGDPRKVSRPERARLRAWADWLRGNEKRHAYTLYRQDLPGFGEPMDGAWDGWARINNDTGSGGIIGVFRQGGPESRRVVSVPGLVGDRTYLVTAGPDGREIGRFQGEELSRRGFEVELKNAFDGALFEIGAVP